MYSDLYHLSTAFVCLADILYIITLVDTLYKKVLFSILPEPYVKTRLIIFK